MYRRTVALVATATLLAAACGTSGPTGAPPRTTGAPSTTTATTTIVLPPTTAAPPTTGPPAVVVYHGRTDRNLVGLTFDAGSDAGNAGYRYELMWTVDTLGWKGIDTATVVQRALDAAGPGEIILMHVGSQSTDAAALPAALQARGLGFAPVSDIL